jgi:hypothetical protein
MKTLQGGDTKSAEWNNELIKDLEFIKKHLRYRFSKKIFYRSAGLLVVLGLIARSAWLL